MVTSQALISALERCPFSRGFRCKRAYFCFGFSVKLGSIRQLPAETCKEIKVSEGEAVSGKYWLNTIKSGMSVLAYCDMETDGEFNFEVYFSCY